MYSQEYPLCQLGFLMTIFTPRPLNKVCFNGLSRLATLFSIYFYTSVRPRLSLNGWTESLGYRCVSGCDCYTVKITYSTRTKPVNVRTASPYNLSGGTLGKSAGLVALMRAESTRLSARASKAAARKSGPYEPRTFPKTAHPKDF